MSYSVLPAYGTSGTANPAHRAPPPPPHHHHHHPPTAGAGKTAPAPAPVPVARLVDLEAGGLAYTRFPPPPPVSGARPVARGAYHHRDVAACTALPFDSARTKLIIALTMYNESPDDLARTFEGLVDTLQDLQRAHCLRSRDVVIALVADGADRVHPDAKTWLVDMGFWDPEHPDYSQAKGATMHFFSSTTRLVCPPDEDDPSGADVHMQFVYMLKEKNAKKLDSHAWILEGLAPLLTPDFCVFVDVGTRPRPTAVRRLVQEMVEDPRVAGCCGEITIDDPYGRAARGCSPVIIAQNFEYKMANALDKAFESVFGYVSVLPGAFCAFRTGPWVRPAAGFAGRYNSNSGAGTAGPGGSTRSLAASSCSPLSGNPLEEYFRPLTRKHIRGFDSLGPFNKNMYLAEDRVLCWELVAKDGEDNLLRYVKGSIAETDPMGDLAGLIAQRRRWLNGSLFAKLYAVKHLPRLSRTTHSRERRCAIYAQFAFALVQLVMDWFAVSLFFVQFRVSTDLCLSNSETSPLFSGGGNLQGLSTVLQLAYMALVLVLMISSLSGAKPRDLVWTHRLAFAVFGVFSLATMVLTSAYIFMGGSLALKLLLTFSLSTYFVVGFVHGELHHVLLGIVPYLFALPSWINIFQIYSMSNLHDVSWGTRPEVPEADGAPAGGVRRRRPSHGSWLLLQKQRANNTVRLDRFREGIRQGTTEHAKGGGCGRHGRGCCAGGAAAGGGKPEPVEEMLKRTQRNFMLKTMALWTISNMLLVLLFGGDGSSYTIMTADEFMRLTMGLLFSSMVFRMAGSIWYACTRYREGTSPWWSCCGSK